MVTTTLGTEVEIANAALSHIGISRSLTGDVDGTLDACTDSSLEKAEIDKAYEVARISMLAEHPWTFARKVATLSLIEDLPANSENWGEQWRYAYVYPTDCIHLRKFVYDDFTLGYCQSGWGYYNEWSWPWPQRAFAFVVRVHTYTVTDPDDTTGKVILTDIGEDQAIMEYTEDVTTLTRWDLWARSALAWRLAFEIAIPLSVSPDRAQLCWNMYKDQAWTGKANNTNEDNPYPEPDGPFIAARRRR